MAKKGWFEIKKYDYILRLILKEFNSTIKEEEDIAMAANKGTTMPDIANGIAMAL